MLKENRTSENYCLASALKSQDAALLIVDSLDEEDFVYLLNKRLFITIKSLIQENIAISVTSVVTHGMANGTYTDEIYLHEITLDVHKSFEVPYHIEVLKAMRKTRTYIATLEKACEKANNSRQLDQQLEELVTDLEHISVEQKRQGLQDLAELVSIPFKQSGLTFYEFVKKKINDNANGINSLTGLSTGFPRFDKATDGLQPSWFYVIGARPSEGKSQFLINMMVNMTRLGTPCLFFSLEMPAQDVMTEVLSIVGEYDHRSVQDGTCSPLDLQKVYKAGEIVKELPLYIDDQASLNTTQMRVRIKAAIRRYGIKAVFIDYLQEVTAIGKFSSQQERMQAVSRDIREMAKDLDIPIICAAQVNRESEKTETPTPPLASHLRESGQIEQCAWFIGMLHRPDKYDPNNRPGVLELYIRKNRFGIREKLDYNYKPNHPAYSFKIMETMKHGILKLDETGEAYWNAFE